MKAAGVPWRPLLLTAAAVLAAHLLLLRATRGPLQVADPFATRALLTRTIVAPPPARPEPPGAAPVVGAQPRRAAAAKAPPLPNPAPAPALTAPPAPQQPPQPPQPANPPPSGTPAASFAIPGSVRMHYKVSGQSRSERWEADAELLWRHDGERYEAKLEISDAKRHARSQRSTGRITGDGLAPLRFSDKLRGEEAAHFVRDEGKVSFSSNQPDAPLLPGAQDRLSVLVQLAALIAGDPGKFGPGAAIAIQTATTRDAQTWQFTVEGNEPLQLPGGPAIALKLTRAARMEYDQKVELWLAPHMDYVPVRLRLTQPNGDWLDHQWSSTDRN